MIFWWCVVFAALEKTHGVTSSHESNVLSGNLADITVSLATENTIIGILQACKIFWAQWNISELYLATPLARLHTTLVLNDWAMASQNVPWTQCVLPVNPQNPPYSREISAAKSPFAFYSATWLTAAVCTAAGWMNGTHQGSDFFFSLNAEIRKDCNEGYFRKCALFVFNEHLPARCSSGRTAVWMASLWECGSFKQPLVNTLWLCPLWTRQQQTEPLFRSSQRENAQWS